MKVITRYPIIVNDVVEQKFLTNPSEPYYSSAEGQDDGEFDFVDYNFEGEEDFYNAKGDFGRKLKNFGSKVGKGVGKVGKGIGKVGKSLKKFVGKLKPKKGARKLRRENRKNKDKSKFVDVLPPVVPTSSGTYQKTNPDGTTVEVSKSDTIVAPDGKTYDKSDIAGGVVEVAKNELTGNTELLRVLDSTETATLDTTDGEQIVFKKEDLIVKGEEEKKGMSKGLKTALIIGGVVLSLAVVGLIIYKMNSKSGKRK